MKKSRVFFLSLTIAAALAVLLIKTVYSQTATQAVITWHANNYFPANFKGKALITANTPVTASAELIKNNTLLDLSQATFIWYVNEQLLSRGIGQKEVLFTAKGPEGSFHFVRVIIQLGDELFEASVTMPVVRQQVVIDVPYPNQVIHIGHEVVLRAIPYFFNVASLQELGFTWRIDDKAKRSDGDNEIRLTINARESATKKDIQVLSSVRNNTNPLEFTNTRTKLTIL